MKMFMSFEEPNTTSINIFSYPNYVPKAQVNKKQNRLKSSSIPLKENYLATSYVFFLVLFIFFESICICPANAMQCSDHNLESLVSVRCVSISSQDPCVITGLCSPNGCGTLNITSSLDLNTCHGAGVDVNCTGHLVCMSRISPTPSPPSSLFFSPLPPPTPSLAPPISSSPPLPPSSAPGVPMSPPPSTILPEESYITFPAALSILPTAESLSLLASSAAISADVNTTDVTIVVVEQHVTSTFMILPFGVTNNRINNNKSSGQGSHGKNGNYFWTHVTRSKESGNFVIVDPKNGYNNNSEKKEGKDGRGNKTVSIDNQGGSQVIKSLNASTNITFSPITFTAFTAPPVRSIVAAPINSTSTPFSNIVKSNRKMYHRPPYSSSITAATAYGLTPISSPLKVVTTTTASEQAWEEGVEEDQVKNKEAVINEKDAKERDEDVRGKGKGNPTEDEGAEQDAETVEEGRRHYDDVGRHRLMLDSASSSTKTSLEAAIAASLNASCSETLLKKVWQFVVMSLGVPGSNVSVACLDEIGNIVSSLSATDPVFFSPSYNATAVNSAGGVAVAVQVSLGVDMDVTSLTLALSALNTSLTSDGLSLVMSKTPSATSLSSCTVSVTIVNDAVTQLTVAPVAIVSAMVNSLTSAGVAADGFIVDYYENVYSLIEPCKKPNVLNRCGAAAAAALSGLVVGALLAVLLIVLVMMFLYRKIVYEMYDADDMHLPSTMGSLSPATTMERSSEQTLSEIDDESGEEPKDLITTSNDIILIIRAVAS